MKGLLLLISRVEIKIQENIDVFFFCKNAPNSSFCRMTHTEMKYRVSRVEKISTAHYPVLSQGLTLCILMDFPIHIVAIRMGLLILYFKRSHVRIPQLECIILKVPEDCFDLNKKCRP